MAQKSWKMDNDETGCQPPEGPFLCFNNCGFFGSAATMNFCSKCYKDFVLKQAQSSSSLAAVENSGVSQVRAESSVEATGEIPSHRPPNRCNSCNRRVGLTGFVCRCGNTYCALHRYSDKHNCQFDYKASSRDAIAKANPVVKAKKIDEI